MKKRFALVHPTIKDGNLTPPIGILILASIIKNKGWEVGFFDERLDITAIDKLIVFKPDIVGISTVTASVLRAKEIASTLKMMLPNTIIVFGGPHPTAMPYEVIAWDCVDIVVVSEGESIISRLLDWYEQGKNLDKLSLIPNLFYKKNNLILNTPIAPFLTSEEFDSLPTPFFDLLALEDIFKKTRHGLFSKGNRILPVMSSRGCPNNCTYCCRTMGFKIRYRSVKSVVQEIEKLVSRYNVDEIWFEDDNFTANKKRCIQILDELINRKFGIWIKFANGIRADGIDELLLDKMIQAGCYSISFGIESGSDRILKMMHKNLSLQTAKKNVMLAKAKGLLVGANCIIGYPGETIDDVKESLDYFMSLDLDSMAIVNLIPFPGTEVRRLCEEKGYLTKDAENWDNYIFDIESPRILIETPYLSKQQLLDCINVAYKKMYMNPKRILRLLKHLDFKSICQGAKVLLKKI